MKQIETIRLLLGAGRRLALLLAGVLAVTTATAQRSTLQKQGTATRLMVEGKPFFILGGELGNSSASCAEDIERIFPKLRRMGLNTVLVPVCWDLLEPEEGVFDFTLTDKVLQEARTNGLKVVFLWFGAWKNSMSCYAPLWFKQDTRRFPRARTREGKPLEIASAFSGKVYEADRRAFSRWLQHVAEADREEGTVIMVQIENEIGMLEEARDYAPAAVEAFRKGVPSVLTDYLRRNRKNLHPQLLRKWESRGCLERGGWYELFGEDVYTDELFMAWHYASYVGALAEAARTIYNVPLYVNAAMNSRGRKPGEYPSAGPLAHLVDIWHCAAPEIDLLAPDLYDKGFADWVAQYHLPDNPLFIPEVRLTEDDGVRAFYVFGEHEAIGISPFSIEDEPETPDSPLVQGYAKLKEAMPLLFRYQGKGAMHGLLFDQEHKERLIVQDNKRMTCRHYFTLPWDARATDGSVWPEGGGVVLKLAENEYMVMGSGIVIEFESLTEQRSSNLLGEDGFAQARGDTSVVDKTEKGWCGKRVGLGPVDEVRVEADGTWQYVRRLNGDQTHQGRHVRIPVGQFQILHVKLYEYE